MQTELYWKPWRYHKYKGNMRKRKLKRRKTGQDPVLKGPGLHMDNKEEEKQISSKSKHNFSEQTFR